MAQVAELAAVMDSTERVSFRCSAIIFRDHDVLLLRRDRDGQVDWVLPGGTPRPGESVASCTRREVGEETGLQVSVDRVAFVLETSNPAADLHLLEPVFTTNEIDRSATPRLIEAGLTPIFYPIEETTELKLRPPVAGHLRGLYARGGRGGGAYLGNMWRPGTDRANSQVHEVGGGERSQRARCS